jgi:hypothetical protein
MTKYNIEICSLRTNVGSCDRWLTYSTVQYNLHTFGPTSFLIFAIIWYSKQSTIIQELYKLDYIHTVLVILNENPQRKSHKPYGSPTSAMWLQLLRKQTNTGTSTALIAETRRSTRTRFRALSRLVTSTKARWSYWRLKLETLCNESCYTYSHPQVKGWTGTYWDDSDRKSRSDQLEHDDSRVFPIIPRHCLPTYTKVGRWSIYWHNQLTIRYIIY